MVLGATDKSRADDEDAHLVVSPPAGDCPQTGQPRQIVKAAAQFVSRRRTGASGYALFALPVAMGALATITAARARHWGEMVLFCVITFLLVVTALTPSYDSLHNLCVALAVLLAYLYFAAFLAEGLWLAVHCSFPIVLATITAFHSLGLWQKSLIICFVMLLNVYYHLHRRKITSARQCGQLRRRPGLPGKRRVVYLLDTSARPWPKRRSR